MSKFLKIMPNVHCPRGHFYLLLNPRETEDIENIKEIFRTCLEKLESSEYQKYKWDYIMGTLYGEDDDNP